MDQRMYDAAQQGLLVTVEGIDTEARFQRFLNSLRSSPEWTEQQVAEVEQGVRRLLGIVCTDERATQRAFELRPELPTSASWADDSRRLP